MGEMAEDFNARRESIKEEKDERVRLRTDEVNRLALAHNLKLEWIQPWHVRIEGVLDLYLPHGKWHHLLENKRGRFWDIQKLLKEKGIL